MEKLGIAAGLLVAGAGAYGAVSGAHILWEAGKPLPTPTSEFQSSSASIQAELGMPEVSAAANDMYSAEKTRTNINDIDEKLTQIDKRPLGTILLLGGGATIAAGVAVVNISRRNNWARDSN